MFDYILITFYNFNFLVFITFKIFAKLRRTLATVCCVFDVEMDTYNVLIFRVLLEMIQTSMETSGITSEEEVQESAFCGKSVAHNFLGLTRGNTGTLSGKGRNSKQCTV